MNIEEQKHRKKWWAIFFSWAYSMSMVYGLLLLSCEKESNAGTIKLDTLNLATHRSYNPIIHFMDSMAVKAILHAGWASVYDTRQETQLGGGVKVEFLSKFTGQVVSTLTADSALIDDRTKDMTARGNVVVVSTTPTGQRTVRTTLMMWSNTRQKLHSTEFVSIVAPQEQLQGYGFESDQNLERYTIYKVSGQTMSPVVPESRTIASTKATK